ncbi:hypothetical protein GGI20_005250, partial [Coemansia sp. BCRC 34301]
MDYVYPFGDDVLFRGNAATLERLALILDAKAVTMLREHKVFTPTSHPRLGVVDISFDDNFAPDVFATAAECMQFVLDIGPTAPVRGLEG